MFRYVYGTSQTKTVVLSFLLELGKSNILPLLPSSPEVPVRALTVTKSFLWSALGYLIHPWELGNLEAVEKLVLFDGRSEFGFSFVPLETLNTICKRPVVCESRSACVLHECSSLHIVGVQFISKSLVGFHLVAASNARFARFLADLRP